MKANAPEKIYLIRNISTSTSLNTTNDCHEKYLQEWYIEREKDVDIEYTRTDAFIEKAKKWFEKQPELYDANGVRCYGMEDFDDFKKYIEGE